jgi:hypothetical protein
MSRSSWKVRIQRKDFEIKYIYIYVYIYIYIWHKSIPAIATLCFILTLLTPSLHNMYRPPRAIIRWVTNIKFLYFKKTSHSTDPLFLSFTMNYYKFVLASYILKSSKNKYKYKIIKTIIRLPLVLSWSYSHVKIKIKIKFKLQLTTSY